MLARDAPGARTAEIELEIRRDGAVLFAGTTSVGEMRRSSEELVAALSPSRPPGRRGAADRTRPRPARRAATLHDGDHVRIAIAGIGTLEHDIYLEELTWRRR